MRAPALRLLLASLLIVTTPLPVLAQFGFPGLPGMRRGPLPLPLPVPGRGLGRGFFPGMPFGRMHRTFGILGAVVVGSFILGRLSRRDGVEVTRRTRVMLDRDQDRELVETYQTKDGGNRVTITAAPVQRVSDIRDDPVLKQTADTAKHATEEAQAEKQTAKSKNTTKIESEFLKVDSLPPDTQCRKVTTEFELKTVARRGGKKEDRQANSQGPDTPDGNQGGSNKPQTADNKSSNTSILCQTGGEWKPASA